MSIEPQLSLEEQYELARQEMAALQDAKAARWAAQGPIIRFVRDSLAELHHRYPVAFEGLRLLLPVGKRLDQDLVFAGEMSREWAASSAATRLWLWQDYLQDVRRGVASFNDYRHICRPVFNRLVALPGVGHFLMYNRLFMRLILRGGVDG